MKPQESMWQVRLYKDREEVCLNNYVWFSVKRARAYAKEKKFKFQADYVMLIHLCIGDREENPAYNLWDTLRGVMEVEKEDADTFGG